MSTFRQVPAAASATAPSAGAGNKKSFEYLRSDSCSSCEGECVSNKGKEPSPISALVIPSNPEERRYKERIGDGSSESYGLPLMVVVTPQQQQGHESQEHSIRELQENFNLNDFRAKLKVAEALAQASNMTSPAAKRRLEARKIEMDLNNKNDKAPLVLVDEDNQEYTPPRELLIYIMR